jgi:hypothetical protein
MSRITKSVAAVVTALTCVGLGYAPSASAAATPYDNLTQQGRLLDETGAPIDAIQLTFTFTLYDALTAGNVLWTETQSITPDKGYFSAQLGETVALPPAVFDGTKVLFLGIKIGTDTEMAPRQAVTSVPFALRAREADHATSAATTPQATHANTADSATAATHATSADTATSATSATTATNATTATTAGSVTTISGNFVEASGTGTGLAVATCPKAGQFPTGGGCVAPSAISLATFTGGKAGAGFECETVTGTGSVTAYAACAN